MTDKQILQSLLRDFFICLVCGKPGSRLCEMHAADERTEIERQKDFVQCV